MKKYTEITEDNMNEHAALSNIFSDVYGLSLTFQFKDLIKKLKKSRYVIFLENHDEKIKPVENV